MDPENRKYQVEALIEIPKGTQNKYEFDSGREVFRLDRVLYSPLHYPTDYGFIPETLAADGDALDILVLITNPTFPGCLVPAYVIGDLAMRDDQGFDTKILSVARGDPRLANIKSYSNLEPHLIKELEYFFRRYKELEEKTSRIGSWHDADHAMEVIAGSRLAWKKNTGRNDLC